MPPAPWRVTEVDPSANDHYSDHVAKQVNATAAKATFLRLLDEAAAGEEIEITRHGRPVARLVPPSGRHSLEGLFQGNARTAVDEETLLNTEEMWDFD
jgi:prevent-host-death family protein